MPRSPSLLLTPWQQSATPAGHIWQQPTVTQHAQQQPTVTQHAQQAGHPHEDECWDHNQQC